MDKRSFTAGIVIPFYQKEAGILRRCLDSIRNQTFSDKVVLVIVDDSSPLPAVQEVNAALFPENIEIVILRQKNAGPGIARNKGFDYLVERGVSFIALLDSDDMWEPEHLERAATAFALDADIYSSNWILTDDTDAFAERGVTVAQLEKHEAIPNGGFLRQGLVEQECSTSTIKLSALVVTAKFLQTTRFDSYLRYASEDRLFILTLAIRKPKVFLSLVPEVKAGRGVNIYESVDYGTLSNFNTLRDKLNGRMKMKRLLMQTQMELAHSFDAQIERTRRACALNLYSCLRKGQFSSIFSFIRIAAKNPVVLFYLVTAPFRRFFMTKN
ncbi:hypothetical protein AEST_30400 [Alishewanella aestuarii B11]|uniref:Glycosyltransferase 2-like domain-containing protein n=1 Tax=Alishewanella aestuarii B11 TaxID=1197174 RepID=J1QFD6_9ALTE|nr:glycosyltransferase family A protein [Alishewanella aestuarii]EJI84206.1 hypothetical protein AEST_30400 [Alishewanella aestuarii B11]